MEFYDEYPLGEHLAIVRVPAPLLHARENRKDVWQESEAWRNLAFAAQFKVNKLARLCGVSVRTLQRHFALNAGITITVWLQGIRLHEAYGRLKAGARVKKVAYDLGYKQLSHFSREFKSQHGITPSFLNGSLLPLSERMFRRDVGNELQATA